MAHAALEREDFTRPADRLLAVDRDPELAFKNDRAQCIRMGVIPEIVPGREAGGQDFLEAVAFQHILESCTIHRLAFHQRPRP